MGGEEERAQYRQLAGQLRGKIESGELQPGDRLPTNVELAEESGLTRVTVQQAIKLLKAEGLVETRRGGGTIVIQLRAGLIELLQQNAPATPKRVLFYGLSADEAVWELVRVRTRMIELPDQVVALTPRHSKDSYLESPEAKARRSYARGSNRTSTPTREAVIKADIRAGMDVRPVQVVPTYRVAVLDYELPSAGEHRPPGTVLYVRDGETGRLEPAPLGVLTSSESTAIRRWVLDQVRSTDPRG